MKTPPPGFLVTPTWSARVLVAVAAQVLPADERDRYAAEFSAELCALPARRQIMTAASMMAGSFALRHALHDPEKGLAMSAHRPLRCRSGMHSYQRVNDDNPESRITQHLECERCGKIKEDDHTDDFPKKERPLFIYPGGSV